MAKHRHHSAANPVTPEVTPPASELLTLTVPHESTSVNVTVSAEPFDEPEAPVVEAAPKHSKQTLMEMEAGRKALERYRR